MAYCTIQDVEYKAGGAQALAQLADRVNGGTMDAAALLVVGDAIEQADAMINGYIGKQVFVPIAPAQLPALIKHMSARMAVYLMREARIAIDPETHGRQHKADLEFLDLIKKGEITLGVDPAPPAASARIDRQTERPLFKDVSRRKLQGFS